MISEKDLADDTVRAAFNGAMPVEIFAKRVMNVIGVPMGLVCKVVCRPMTTRPLEYCANWFRYQKLKRQQVLVCGNSPEEVFDALLSMENKPLCRRCKRVHNDAIPAKHRCRSARIANQKPKKKPQKSR